MITATWWENSALMVGIPRRSTEWSTESSCTRVARWISSTTAASVKLPRLRFLSLLFQRPAQPVQDPYALRVARRGQVEPAPQDRFGHDVSTLFNETDPQRLRGPELPLGGAQRLLELGDRFVEQ